MTEHVTKFIKSWWQEITTAFLLIGLLFAFYIRTGVALEANRDEHVNFNVNIGEMKDDIVFIREDNAGMRATLSQVLRLQEEILRRLK